jgi:hypothetical protein
MTDMCREVDALLPERGQLVILALLIAKVFAMGTGTAEKAVHPD